MMPWWQARIKRPGKATGEKGGVYAVDIVPGFLEYINTSSKEIGLTNVIEVIP